MSVFAREEPCPPDGAPEPERRPAGPPPFLKPVPISAALLGVAAGVTVAAIVRKGGFYPPDDFVLPWILVVLAAVSAIAPQRRLTGRQRAVVGALAAFATWWMAVAVATGVPAHGVRLAASAAGFAGAFVLGCRLDAARRRTLQRCLVALGAVVALVGLVAVAIRLEPLALTKGSWRLAGTLTYSDAAGLLLAMVAPLAAALDDDVDGRLRRAGLLLILAGLVATISRGPVLALALALPLMPFACLRRAVGPALAALVVGGAAVAVAPSPAVQPQILLALGAGLALMALWPVGRAEPATQARFPASLDGPKGRSVPARYLVAGVVVGSGLLIAAVSSGGMRETVRVRTSLVTVTERGAEAKVALHQFASHPLAGVGPDHSLVLPGRGRAAFAHDEYVQVAAGAGIVGVVLLGAVGLAVVRAVHRSGWQSSAAAASLVVLAVAGLFDFTWHMIAIGITAGWIASLTSRRTT